MQTTLAMLTLHITERVRHMENNTENNTEIPESSTEQKTNSDSVIALILGIVSLIIPFVGFITAIVGIIFSMKSFKTIKQTGEPGKGLSITGLVCSIVAILMYLLAVGIFIFVFVIGAMAETGSI